MTRILLALILLCPPAFARCEDPLSGLNVRPHEREALREASRGGYAIRVLTRSFNRRSRTVILLGELHFKPEPHHRAGLGLVNAFDHHAHESRFEEVMNRFWFGRSTRRALVSLGETEVAKMNEFVAGGITHGTTIREIERRRDGATVYNLEADARPSFRRKVDTLWFAVGWTLRSVVTRTKLAVGTAAFAGSAMYTAATDQSLAILATAAVSLAAQVLIHHGATRAFYGFADVRGRDRDMAREIIRILRADPGVVTLPVTVGVYHTRGIAENLKAHGFREVLDMPLLLEVTSVEKERAFWNER